MKLYAIGDLHLPGGDEKPMDIFGPQWDHHFEKIAANWMENIQETDSVLIPGDISWAMQLENAIPDLQMISQLPGKKYLLRGNHDYWWSSVSRIRSILPQGMYVIQNDAAETDEAIICGTRGWLVPTKDTALSDADIKIMNREAARLQLSLDEAEKKAVRSGKPIVVMLHYPPTYGVDHDTPFTDVLEKYPVRNVVYGHLHGAGIGAAFRGERKGIRYDLVSCDSLAFCPREIKL